MNNTKVIVDEYFALVTEWKFLSAKLKLSFSKGYLAAAEILAVAIIIGGSSNILSGKTF